MFTLYLSKSTKVCRTTKLDEVTRGLSNFLVVFFGYGESKLMCGENICVYPISEYVMTPLIKTKFGVFIEVHGPRIQKPLRSSNCSPLG